MIISRFNTHNHWLFMMYLNINSIKLLYPCKANYQSEATWPYKDTSKVYITTNNLTINLESYGF